MRLVSSEQVRVTAVAEPTPSQIYYVKLEEHQAETLVDQNLLEAKKQRFDRLCETIAMFPGFLLSHTEFLFAFLANLFLSYSEFPDVVEKCIFTMIFGLGCAAQHPKAKVAMNRMMEILANTDPVWLSLRVRYKMFQLFEGILDPAHYSNVLADLLVFKSLLKSKHRTDGPWEPGVPKLTNEVNTFLSGFEMALRGSMSRVNGY
ncbi:hypothetical protein K7432_006799 [Basidiobolus ranarum]|uniref:Uncharacterized protein n=1 Tax=Basidiobolus ranarum TaxID=34480 RepID=A0ABR2W131_9FUNG